MSSFKRKLQRGQQHRVDPREAFARAVGEALERFALSGGTHEQAAHSLLRYSAQTFIMAPRQITSDAFSAAARTAFDRELRASQSTHGKN